ncbi:MAG: bifunctional oligoribonuclease/PAP phosphatase NrnA [Actinomycetota bacterium]|nr:bifunctional oligoribonuclease/PAP phosphatase NrnA [Actinomycetota bacterium]
MNRYGLSSKESMGVKAKDEEIRAVVREIESNQRFVLATHRDPDGDAIGSLIGLGLFLKKIGKDVRLGWDDRRIESDVDLKPEIPSIYDFLSTDDLLANLSVSSDHLDCFIALDCASLSRLGSLNAFIDISPVSINIDHHQGNLGFAKINFIDVNSPATAEMVYRIIKELDGELDFNIASSLYVGLVTDTGRFQYSNTDESTFAMAKDLLAYGVEPANIFRNVYENESLSYLKLIERFLSRAVLDGAIIHSFINQEDLTVLGVKLDETESLINMLRVVKEAKVAFVLKETVEGRWKVSLRSKGEIDVARVASFFGGGGHKAAAGYVSAKERVETTQKLIDTLKAAN